MPSKQTGLAEELIRTRSNEDSAVLEDDAASKPPEFQSAQPVVDWVHVERVVVDMLTAWCKDRSLAEEAFQEAYLKYASTRPGFGKEVEVLRTLGWRWLRYFFKKRKRRSDFLARNKHDLLAQFADTAISVATSAAEQASIETLKACMEKLPPGQRDLLQRRVEEGASFDELADKLATSPSALRARAVRARVALRECIRSQHDVI